jgi:hypothetical protein
MELQNKRITFCNTQRMSELALVIIIRMHRTYSIGARYAFIRRIRIIEYWDHFGGKNRVLYGNRLNHIKRFHYTFPGNVKY